MSLLIALSRAIDAFNLRVGKAAAWLIVVAIVVSAVNATVRKLFDTSSNAWLELQWVLFGAVFMLCASWTLAANEHIRIDIVNSQLSRRVRDWIEVVGHALFLLPICLLMVYLSWPYFLLSAPTLGELLGAVARFAGSFFTFSGAAIWEAWRTLLSLGEQSTNAGGLPQWPAKLIIPLGFLFLAAQGVSELIKRVAVMQGLMSDPHDRGGHHAAAAAEAERIKSELAGAAGIASPGSDTPRTGTRGHD